MLTASKVKVIGGMEFGYTQLDEKADFRLLKVAIDNGKLNLKIFFERSAIVIPVTLTVINLPTSMTRVNITTVIGLVIA